MTEGTILAMRHPRSAMKIAGSSQVGCQPIEAAVGASTVIPALDFRTLPP